MAKPRRPEPWEPKAEALVRSVKHLIEYHGREIDHALRQSMSENEARASLQQLMMLAEAVELELLQVGQPNPVIRRWVPEAISLGVGAVITTVVGLVTTEGYEALLDAEAKADEVIVCVIQQDNEPDAAGDGFPGFVDPGSEEPTVVEGEGRGTVGPLDRGRQG